MDYFNAFWVGGLICALVQILLDKTKLMPGRVMVLLVCTGSILGERSHRHRWCHRAFHRRLHRLRSWCLCSPDFFLSGKLVF